MSPPTAADGSVLTDSPIQRINKFFATQGSPLEKGPQATASRKTGTQNENDDGGVAARRSDGAPPAAHAFTEQAAH
jgi:hypothetical protein